MSCTLLLLARLGCLVFYAVYSGKIAIETFLMFSSLIMDLPNFLVMNITLALIWQWHRIARLLTKTEEELRAIKTGQSGKRLILMQCLLLALFIVDTFFLTAHYYFGLWPSSFHQNKDTDKIYAIQNKTWLRLRISYKVVQIIFMTLLMLASCLVFKELVKVVRSDESLKPLKR